MLDQSTSDQEIQSERQIRLLKVVNAFNNANKAYLVPGEISQFTIGDKALA